VPACLPYGWRQDVGSPLFVENELALELGDGEDAASS